MDDPLLFLDTVLNCLTDEKKKLYTPIELLFKIKKQLKVQNEDKEAASDLYSMFQRAITYLIDEGYVFTTQPKEKLNYSITFKGYVKLKTNSFSKARYIEMNAARNARITRILDWTHKTVTPIIAIVALFLSVLNSCNSKPNTVDTVKVSTVKIKA